MKYRTISIALMLTISKLCAAQNPMNDQIPVTPFSEAEVRAALDLFEPGGDSAELAQSIVAGSRQAESISADYRRDPEAFAKLHNTPPGRPPILGFAISPDLLMMLSLVSPELEVRVRSYIAETHLLKGDLAGRWETAREKMKQEIGDRKKKSGT